MLELTAREPWNPVEALSFACAGLTDTDFRPSAKSYIRAVHAPHNPSYIANAMHKWESILYGVSNEQTKCTLAATTQRIVSLETENHRVPRQIMKQRFPFLRPRRLNEKCYTDIFEWKVAGKVKYTQIFFLAKSRMVV